MCPVWRVLSFDPIRKLLEGEETHFNSGMSFGAASYSYQPRASASSSKSSQREKEGAMKESFKDISEDKDEADINSNNWTKIGRDIWKSRRDILYIVNVQLVHSHILYLVMATLTEMFGIRAKSQYFGVVIVKKKKKKSVIFSCQY